MSADAGLAESLEQIAVSLAGAGIERIRREPASAAHTSSKSTPTDLVTDTDRAVEVWLISELAGLRPDDAVLGEEGGVATGNAASAGASGVRWLLDPIDGTVNFVLGIPQYAISIAAEVDGVVVAGAVANAATGELFHARRGGGAWCGDARLDGPRSVPMSAAVIGTGFGYDPSMRAKQARVVAELISRIGDIRRMGAASLDLCAVAAGQLDGYYEAGLNPWDYAAGALLAEEAGCLVSGLRGRPPSGRLVAVAPATWAPEFFELLSSLGADEVSSPN